MTAHSGPWPADMSAFCFEMPHSADSILFESGKGVRLFDEQGRGYLDALSGVFVTCFGYDCEPITSAMTEQLGRMAFNPPLHGTNRNALRLAEALVELAPEGITSVKFTSGGSEAVEAAARMARFFHRFSGNPGKVKILSNYDGYHGSTFGALSITGHPVSGMFGPGLPGIVHVWPPEFFESTQNLSKEDACELAAATVERTILAEGPDSVAALIVEPLSYLRAMAVPTAAYFARLREICDRHNVLLVFDEIVTGFGRTGANFAAQTFGTTPDLICVGKGISGGYAPLAAVLVGERVAGLLGGPKGPKAFGPSHTYSANPLTSAAGLAAVNHFRDGRFLDVIAALDATLRPRITALVGDRGTMHGAGLLYGIKLKDPEGIGTGTAVALACLRRGLIIRGDDDYIVIAPPFVTTEADVQEICLTLGDALDEVCGPVSA
ncbi:aminotransferase family protein [Actinokineospora sp. 24-640]